jgi:DnaJ-class molecular chaperone
MANIAELDGMSEVFLRMTSMRLPDDYARLGVARDASQDEIKNAYRRLAFYEARRD